MWKWVQNFLIFMAAIFVGLILVEIFLRTTAAIGLRVDALSPPIPLRIEDRILGQRGNPAYPGHDERGFRNAEVPAEVDLLALGDSQTYGWNVMAQEAWPTLVASASGSSLYNQGMGGFSSLHSLVLLPDTLKMKPKAVLFGLYFGNDFVDAFDFAARNHQLANWLAPAEAGHLAVRESDSPIYDEISGLLEETVGINAANNRYVQGSSNLIYRVKQWIAANLYLYRVLNASRTLFSSPPATTLMVSGEFKALKRRVESGPYQGRLVAFDDGEWKTILTPAYRGATIDTSEPRVAAGVELVEKSLAKMDDLVRATGASFCVVLLPTKEAVFHSRFAALGQIQGRNGMEQLYRDETRLNNHLTAFLRNRSIPYVSTLPDLSSAKSQPYPETADGHPNVLGNEIISSAILRERTICIPNL